MVLSDASLMALTPKISGPISMLCSLYILNEIRIDYRSRRLPITPVTRAVVGMSVLVFLVGLAWAASNWMVPAAAAEQLVLDEDAAEEPSAGHHALAPSGNRWTCQLQGFFFQFSLGPPVYNAAILYFAQRSIFHNESVVSRRVEISIHVGIMMWCACSATLFLLKDKYHSIGPVCWTKDAPDCADDDSCNVEKYSLVLYCLPLWLALVYTITSCIRIRRHVQQNHSDRKKVTQHADSLVVLYSLAIFITYSPCIIWSFTFWNDASPYWLLWAFALLEPMQGIWNLAIFLMNRRKAARARLRKFFTSICGLCLIWETSDVSDCNDDDTTSSTDPNQHGRRSSSRAACRSSTDFPAISLESQA